MIRTLATALLCAAAIVAGDLVFRGSLLHRVRPEIVSPTDQAIVEPPIQLRWDGPPRMRVLLATVGAAPRDLGIHESPLTIGREQFPRDAGYQLDVEALQFGGWIRASRVFQVHTTSTATTAQNAPAPSDHQSPAWDAKELLHALEAARTARDKAHGRAKFLTEENAALRDESERLSKQLENLYKAQEDDAARVDEVERRASQLADENRALAEENTAVRLRLSTVIPCTVWGYYSYPRPQTVPATRRVLLVSDARGQIFRVQPECELIRRADVTAASICFCIGNSFGG